MTVTKEINRAMYGLTDVQRRWSTAKIRIIVNDKRFAKEARQHFYAELVSRRRRG